MTEPNPGDTEITGETGSLDLGGPLPPEVLQEQLRRASASPPAPKLEPDEYTPRRRRTMIADEETLRKGLSEGGWDAPPLPTPDPPPNPPASAMSLLDLFAANALSGMLAAGVNGMYSNKDDLIHASNQAYVIARAMLAAREVIINDTLMSAIQRGRR